MVTNKRSNLTDKTLTELYETLNSCAEVTKEIVEEHISVKESCNRHNLDWRKYRNSMLAMAKVAKNPNGATDTRRYIKSMTDNLTGWEQFYAKVFCIETVDELISVMPFNYSEFIQTAMEDLPEQEVILLKLRYGDNKTLDVIGQEIGKSGERCRQILEKAILHMRQRKDTLRFGASYAELLANEKTRLFNEIKNQVNSDSDKITESGLRAAIHSAIDEYMNALQVTISPTSHIAALGLTPRCYQALLGKGIDTIEKAMALDERSVREIPGVGEVSVKNLRKALVHAGYHPTF